MRPAEAKTKRIVLMGNPNVGKSVLFHRLTGVHVIASNYPGTTVGYTRGFFTFPSDLPDHPAGLFHPGQRVEVIDAPGIYGLEPTCKADEVALDFLNSADLVINVVDSTNLERNLCLTLQILERNVPTVVALNLWDETEHLGISIDPGRVEEMLGVPVVPTVGVTGEGIRTLAERLNQAEASQNTTRTRPERWAEMGKVVSRCQTLTHHHHTFLQRLSDLSVQPHTGLPMALVVIFLAFSLIRLLGEFFITGDVGLYGAPWFSLPFGTERFFDVLWLPVMHKLSAWLGPGTLLHHLLIGTLIDGRIDLGQSFGMLTTGLFIPLGAVLPYVISFYLVLSFLEDFGYLPRLAVLLDTLMHRVGLHGYAIIPTLLGLGCNVPAVMATRILESRRQRFITATLVSIGVPCAALQAMIIGLVGRAGTRYVAAVYLTLFLVWLILGMVLSRLVSGFSPELIIEIPHYRFPPLGPFLKKLKVRIFGFLREALPVVLLGVLVVNLLYVVGVFEILADLTEPIMVYLLGLPKEAIVPILIGFLRKDVAVGMLAPLGLSPAQLVVACTILAMFFPCVATFVVLLKELGIRDMLKASGIMALTSLAVGGILNLLFSF